jgi:hypothetical protein
MTGGGEDLSGLRLAGTCLLSCLIIRPEGMRRLGASVGEVRTGG